MLSSPARAITPTLTNWVVIMNIEKTNCYVVVPSRNKDNEEMSFEQIVNTGKAVGFRGSIERIKRQRFIMIVDKETRKAKLAQILQVTPHHSLTSKVARVDVKFGICKDFLWSDLKKITDVEVGRNNTRYVWLTGFHR